jgi:fermentation-respiration switch protein FrsA (DUF1100 family)
VTSPRAFRGLLRIALALIAFFVVAILCLWIFQERFVFLPPAIPAAQGRNAVRVDFAAPDGQALFGFVVEAPHSRSTVGDSTRGAILVFHGNGDLADSWVDWAREASARTGLPVFLAEYRGYGGLPGRPTFSGVVSDAQATLDLVMKRFTLDQNGVVLYGHSLGSGVAMKLATERRARAVVLEAPFTTLADMGGRAFGPPLSWVLPLISRSPFAPLRQAPAVAAPISVVVGGRDEVVPPEMGRAVYAAASHKGELLEVASANHGNIADRGGHVYWDWFSRVVASPATVRATPSTTRAIRP